MPEVRTGYVAGTRQLNAYEHSEIRGDTAFVH